MSSKEPLDRSNESDEVRGFYGLTGDLWRMALVVGLAQFSMSFWAWHFSIFLEFDLASTFGVVLQRWEIGFVFSVGTAATILGYILSGTIADLMGRRSTMIIAFLPMTVGLIGLRFYPVWPIIILEYSLVQFGWAFVIIVSSAIAADEIGSTAGRNSARVFNVVLLPAFLVDGLSPIAASVLLDLGYNASDLHLIAGLGAMVALLATLAFIGESLGAGIREEARSGPFITVRGLGRSFWKFALAMGGYIVIYRAAVAYLGNLVVGEFGGISAQMYGYAWSGFSLTSAVLLSKAGNWADKNLKAAMIIALIGNSLLICAFSVASGIVSLWILNVSWALPIALWIGAEKTLVVSGVGKKMKGRALGTYHFVIAVGGLFAFAIGAYLWDIWSNLRSVFLFSGILSLVMMLILAIVLRTSGNTRTEEDELALGTAE